MTVHKQHFLADYQKRLQRLVTIVVIYLRTECSLAVQKKKKSEIGK